MPQKAECSRETRDRTIRMNAELTKIHEEVISNLKSELGITLRANLSSCCKKPETEAFLTSVSGCLSGGLFYSPFCFAERKGFEPLCAFAQTDFEGCETPKIPYFSAQSLTASRIKIQNTRFFIYFRICLFSSRRCFCRSGTIRTTTGTNDFFSFQ